jgi:hypothetical protein
MHSGCVCVLCGCSCGCGLCMGGGVKAGLFAAWPPCCFAQMKDVIVALESNRVSTVKEVKSFAKTVSAWKCVPMPLPRCAFSFLWGEGGPPKPFSCASVSAWPAGHHRAACGVAAPRARVPLGFFSFVNHPLLRVHMCACRHACPPPRRIAVENKLLREIDGLAAVISEKDTLVEALTEKTLASLDRVFEMAMVRRRTCGQPGPALCVGAAMCVGAAVCLRHRTCLHGTLYVLFLLHCRRH